MRLVFGRSLQEGISEVGVRAEHPQASWRETSGLSRGSESVRHLCALPICSVHTYTNTTPDPHRSVLKAFSIFLVIQYFQASRCSIASVCLQV